MSNHRFSAPVELHADDEFDHAVRFAVDKRDTALVPVLNASNSHVRVVSDDSDENLDFIRDQIMAGLFGYVPSVHQKYVRDALRPASRGVGRDRFR